MATRRHFLAGVSAIFTATAGCTAFSQRRKSEVTIPELSIENKDDEPHHVDVLLLHKGTPVFLRSLEVAAGRYDGEDLKSVSGRVWRDVATTRQRYTLYARINQEQWFATRFREFNSECVRVVVQINQQGEGTFVYFACYEGDRTTTP